MMFSSAASVRVKLTRLIIKVGSIIYSKTCISFFDFIMSLVVFSRGNLNLK